MVKRASEIQSILNTFLLLINRQHGPMPSRVEEFDSSHAAEVPEIFKVKYECVRSICLPNPVSTPLPSGKFAKCTACFNGQRTSDVQAFIDSTETYKECSNIEDTSR